MTDINIEPEMYSIMGSWNYNTATEECECGNKLTRACKECESEYKTECEVIHGSCNHSFHTHCLNRYKNASKTTINDSCPIDGIRFEAVNVINGEDKSWVRKVILSQPTISQSKN